MKKLENNKGYTLTELLCALAILILLTSCVTLGMNLSTKSFETIEKTSSAQELSTVLTTLITDELRYATTIETEPGGDLISYKSITQGAESNISCADGKIYVVDKNKTPWDIVSPEAYGNGCRVKDDFRIVYHAENHRFEVFLKIVDKSGNTLKKADFQVEAIKEIKAPKETPTVTDDQ